MKKQSLLTLSILGCLSVGATNYNALITKEHSKFEETTAYLPTGEIICSMATPLTSEVYKDTSFNQEQSDCSEIYRNEDGQEKSNPVEDRTEELLGTLVLNSCKSILDNNHSRGNGIYAINIDSEYEAFCEMNIDGGGWTLVASKADDGNHYWTWDNLSYLYTGGITGNVNDISKDYQNEGWSNIKADEVLISDSTLSKYMVYSEILNTETLNSEYSTALTTSQEYTARLKSSGWWFSPCDPSGQGIMRTSSPDSDANVWDQGAKGFVWRASNNNGCNYDDTSGGLLNAHTSLDDIEVWTYDQFYHRNFDNDAMTVWVR